MNDPLHISDRDLVGAADAELSPERVAEVRAHLEACWTCRARAKALQDTIAEFVQAHQQDVTVGDAAAPRAMLRARIAELAVAPAPGWRDRFADYFMENNRFAYVAGAMAALTAVLVVVGVVQVSRQTYRLMPDARLTPGVAANRSVEQVCAAGPEARVIPAKVGRAVFDHYGIDRPKPRDYEMDYLIAPELGGADDPKNYWPQPYGIEWNAHVKDALEDHLHQLVCAKKVTLETVQREIAANWIETYKKYFQTNGPLASHRDFTKDRPWEP